MSYLEMFDEEFIDSIDKWIHKNNADASQIESVSFEVVENILSEDFKNEDVE